MQSVFASRVSHASNDPRPPPARAQSAVTDDPRAVAAKVYVVSALTDRIDPYTMRDHERIVFLTRDPLIEHVTAFNAVRFLFSAARSVLRLHRAGV